MNKKNHENFSGIVQARNTKFPRIQENFIIQLSEGRGTKKLSQEVSETKSRILGTLFHLDENLQNPQTRALSGPLSATSRMFDKKNQGMNGNSSQNDHRPEIRVLLSQSIQDLSPGETSYKFRLRIYLLRVVLIGSINNTKQYVSSSTNKTKFLDLKLIFAHDLMVTVNFVARL